jgi:hypothetical protein
MTSTKSSTYSAPEMTPEEEKGGTRAAVVRLYGRPRFEEMDEKQSSGPLRLTEALARLSPAEEKDAYLSKALGWSTLPTLCASRQTH